MLKDEGGARLAVNAWNWGVLHHTLELGGVLDEDTLVLVRCGGATLDAEQASRALRYLEAVVLPKLPAGHRMLANLSVTADPDDGTFHRDDLAKNYSLHHDVLTSVIEFLRTSRGTVSVL